jgi:hypothetical protein
VARNSVLQDELDREISLHWVRGSSRRQRLTEGIGIDSKTLMTFSAAVGSSFNNERTIISIGCYVRAMVNMKQTDACDLRGLGQLFVDR